MHGRGTMTQVDTAQYITIGRPVPYPCSRFSELTSVSPKFDFQDNYLVESISRTTDLTKYEGFLNLGYPESSILMGFSIIDHPLLGNPHLLNPPYEVT